MQCFIINGEYSQLMTRLTVVTMSDIFYEFGTSSHELS